MALGASQGRSAPMALSTLAGERGSRALHQGKVAVLMMKQKQQNFKGTFSDDWLIPPLIPDPWGHICLRIQNFWILNGARPVYDRISVGGSGTTPSN